MTPILCWGVHPELAELAIRQIERMERLLSIGAEA